MFYFHYSYYIIIATLWLLSWWHSTILCRAKPTYVDLSCSQESDNVHDYLQISHTPLNHVIKVSKISPPITKDQEVSASKKVSKIKRTSQHNGRNRYNSNINRNEKRKNVYNNRNRVPLYNRRTYRPYIDDYNYYNGDIPKRYTNFGTRRRRPLPLYDYEYDYSDEYRDGSEEAFQAQQESTTEEAETSTTEEATTTESTTKITTESTTTESSVKNTTEPMNVTVGYGPSNGNENISITFSPTDGDLSVIYGTPLSSYDAPFVGYNYNPYVNDNFSIVYGSPTQPGKDYFVPIFDNSPYNSNQFNRLRGHNHQHGFF